TNAVVKANYVIVNGGFFVFESGENLPDHSATFIRDFLQERGYPVIYSNYFPNTLSGFDAAFLTYGNVQSRFTAMDETMVNAMIDYLKEGGSIYLEPGVNFLFGQGNNEELLGLFGIEFVNPQGTNVINELIGLEGTLAEGMVFNSSTQVGNRFIDRYSPDTTGNSKVAFAESGYGDVALQNEGDMYGQKTFSFGYALSELVDVDPQSSRHHLLIRLLEFFGFPMGEDYVAANFELSEQSILPGETVDFTDWSVAAPGTTVSEWAWDFDMDGSMDSYEQNPSHTFDKGGIYDIMLVASNGSDTDTLVRKDVLAVKSGVLVYDGKKDVNGYSGAYIFDYLVSNYYDEVGYTQTLPLDLEGYDAVFLSYGNGGNRSTTPTNLEQKAIESYGMSGGHIYIEGGDVLSESELLWLIFGLIDVESGNNNPIEMLSGQSESLTQGLSFSGSAQFTNNNIDRLIK
ncbi:MAG: PKD domain-containing protein, partial [bacterium]